MAITATSNEYIHTSVIDTNSSVLYDGITWNSSQPIYTINPPTYNTTISTPPTYTTTTMTYPPSMKIDGEIIFKGEKLSDVIAEIRDALYMLKRDRDREEKYKELKEAADHYLHVLNRLKAIEAITGEDAV